jgi:hypothetical protein
MTAPSKCDLKKMRKIMEKINDNIEFMAIGDEYGESEQQEFAKLFKQKLKSMFMIK